MALARDEVKYRAARILSLSPTERALQGLPLTLQDIAKLLGVDPATIKTWKKNLSQIVDEMRADEERRHVLERLERDKQLRRIAERNLAPQDIEEITDDERLALARKVYNDAMGQGATKGEKELAVRMLGMLVERQEMKIGLTADELARRQIEAIRQLQEAGFLGEGNNAQVK